MQIKKAIAQEKSPQVVERLKLIMSFVDQLKGLAREAFDRASAHEEATKVRFPLLIIDGRTDISLPHWMIRDYETKLRPAGKVVETYLPAEGDHGFYGGSSPEAKEAQQRTSAFFRKYLSAGK